MKEVRGEALDVRIHFWLGEHTSQVQLAAGDLFCGREGEREAKVSYGGPHYHLPLALWLRVCVVHFLIKYLKHYLDFSALTITRSKHHNGDALRSKHLTVYAKI